jgi:hypothetical protein
MKDKNRDALRNFPLSRVVGEENADGRNASRVKKPKTGAVSWAKMLCTVLVKTVEALAGDLRDWASGLRRRRAGLTCWHAEKSLYIRGG